MASLSRLEDKKRCRLCGERTWFWKLFRWKTRTPGAFQRFLSKMQQIQSTRWYIRYIQLQFFTYVKLQCISLYNMHGSMKSDEKWIFARQAASNLKDFHFDCFEMGRATAIGDAVKLFSKRTPVRLSWTKWRRLWVLVVKWLRRFSRRFETARTVRSWSWCTDVPTRNSRGFARNWVKGLWKSWSYGRTSGVCEVSWKHIRSIRKDMYSTLRPYNRFWFRSNSSCTIIWRILRAELLGIHLCIQDSKRQRTPGLNKCVVGAHGDTLGRMKSHADFDTFLHKLDQSPPPCTITAWSLGQDDERIELGKCWCSFIRCYLEEFTSSDPSLKQRATNYLG